MKILENTFRVPYVLNEFSDGLVPLDSVKSPYHPREVIQYRSTLSVLVEGEVYTAQTTHSVEESRMWNADEGVMRGVLFRHHRKMIMAKLESVLFPD